VKRKVAAILNGTCSEENPMSTEEQVSLRCRILIFLNIFKTILLRTGSSMLLY
jgi:hypothetical protein